MVTAIICVVLGIICIIAVRTYAKNLAHGCCGGDGDSVKKIGSADSDKSHYPYEKLVKIEGMTCKNCAARVENAFHKLDGTCANVNLGKQQLTLLTKDEISEIAMAIAGKVVGRELNASDHAQMVDSFIDKLGDEV